MNALESPVISRTSADTKYSAQRIAQTLVPGDGIYLSGALGAGKTFFAQQMLAALGCRDFVSSPTFSLVNSYPLNQFVVHHFDFYRVADPEELELIGIRDYFNGHDVCIVEWPERAGSLLPTPRLRIDITIKPQTQFREINIETFERQRSA